MLRFSVTLVVTATVFCSCTATTTTVDDLGIGFDAGLDSAAVSDAASDAASARDAFTAADTTPPPDGGVCANAPDADHDGHRSTACGGDDCDDSDPHRFPGNAEVCDSMGHDEDCNPATYGATDTDTDGYVSSACCNGTGTMAMCGPDCDDGNPGVHPTAPEVCNGLDDDCDTAIDESVPTNMYTPDCDGDMFGVAGATAIVGCSPPSMPPTCPAGTADVWATAGGDCNDANSSINPATTEVCNGVDDNCDHLVDDIIPGTVVCTQGQSMGMCSTSCGTSGTILCNNTCLGWLPCAAPEACNGCDDDADGMIDEGFTCQGGSMRSCTTTCGTPGSQTCDMTMCTWPTCAGPEVCNYCDDNGNGNTWEEHTLSTASSTSDIQDCSGGVQTLYPAGRTCATTPSGPGGAFDLWATLLDGTANDQSGALWIVPASTEHQGWGPTDITIDMEVTVVPPASPPPMSALVPLGGWTILVGHGGPGSAGTPASAGVPAGYDGVGAAWYWSNIDITGAGPPSSSDALRGLQLHAGSGGGPLLCPSREMFGMMSTGVGLNGGSDGLDSAASGTMVQHMLLHFVPDDPSTAPDESVVTITATTPNGTTTTLNFPAPASALPVGTSPLAFGITAGTFTRTGFPGATGVTFGVPVRARVHVFHFVPPSCGCSQPGCTNCQPTFTYYQHLSRAGLCTSGS